MGGWGDDVEVEEEEHGDTGGSGRTQTRPRRNVRALILSSSLSHLMSPPQTHNNHQTHDQSFDNPLNRALQVCNPISSSPPSSVDSLPCTDSCGPNIPRTCHAWGWSFEVRACARVIHHTILYTSHTNDHVLTLSLLIGFVMMECTQYLTYALMLS